MFNIKEELNKIPHRPGSYQMYDKDDVLIYVGKAKDLRKRVGQYFDSSSKGLKVKTMVDQVAYFEYIIVENEVEALVLESNLIKENRPKYNILLRDDKQYPYIMITREMFPRVLKVRNVNKKRGEYFGPFPNAFAVNDIIDLLHDNYQLRNCTLDFKQGQYLKRPCLNYFINRCPGPCIHAISEEVYYKEVEKVRLFFKGKHDYLYQRVTQKMKEASNNQDYELAAKYRDVLRSIDVIVEKQNISNTSSLNLDLISFVREIDTVCIQVFFMRNGKIIDRENFIILDKYHDKNEDIISSFMKQFYVDVDYIPKTILVDMLPSDKELLEEMLKLNKGSKVVIKEPKRGDKYDLLDTVRENAKEMLDRYVEKYLKRERNTESALLDLSDILQINEIDRIECYDVSNTSGLESVGSMIVFEDGKKKPKEYRKFKIKNVVGPDDYLSHKEMLTRRFNRGLEERRKGNLKSGFGKLPSLIIEDGGKGQVNICKEVLLSLNLDIPVIGLVKDEYHNTRGIIFNNNEIPLRVNTPLYRLLFQIQEEAHRFAINYHRKLREQKMKESILDSIEGVGPTRKKALMKHFKSINKIKHATIDELMKVPKMNQDVAKNIHLYFRGEQ